MKERLIGHHTIYGADGEHSTPYMTRIWIGRLRLHIFHRDDADPDPHDHPWEFWTFPLTGYVEEVVDPVITDTMAEHDLYEGHWDNRTGSAMTSFRVVGAFRLHHRTATHTHRVIARYSWLAGHTVDGKIVTIVWRSRGERKWGFLKNRDGLWCWTPWKEYVFGGGKHAPCEPSDGSP
jgi:hypothetical protein